MPSNTGLIIITVEIDDSGEWSRYDIDSKLTTSMIKGVLQAEIDRIQLIKDYEVVK